MSQKLSAARHTPRLFSCGTIVTVITTVLTSFLIALLNFRSPVVNSLLLSLAVLCNVVLALTP